MTDLDELLIWLRKRNIQFTIYDSTGQRDGLKYIELDVGDPYSIRGWAVTFTQDGKYVG